MKDTLRKYMGKKFLKIFLDAALPPPVIVIIVTENLGHKMSEKSSVTGTYNNPYI